MVDLNRNIGAKFVNNYIYYDNKLEGVEQKDVPYILADLSYNKEKSKFFYRYLSKRSNRHRDYNKSIISYVRRR